jgi:hypothetical protein
MQEIKISWCLNRAAEALDVTLVEMDSDGWLPEGTQGWSKFCRETRRRVMAVSYESHLPPELIAFHELAHLVLGHSLLPRSLQVLAYADCEVQAMKVALALGEELLPDSADQWRQEVVEYIEEYESQRFMDETEDEQEMVRLAIVEIREAGLPVLVDA